MAWYYQETPGEGWDYDARRQPIMLADLTIDGRERKVLLQAPKNGFFYVLDRETGQFICRRRTSRRQTWATAIDPVTGKATRDHQTTDFSRGAKLIFPSAMGGHSWQPMAYSPLTGLVYLPVLEAGNFMFDTTIGHVYRPGLRNAGNQMAFPNAGITAEGMPPPVAEAIRRGEFRTGYPDPTPRAFLRAWDPVKQKAVWNVETSGQEDRAGVLATGGRIVVNGSTTGKLRVFNDETGELLREIDVGTSIVAAPATYMIDGVQYITVMAAIGGGAWTYAPSPASAASRYGNAGRILTFRLDGGPAPLPPLLPPVAPVPQPPPLRADAATVARGGELFRADCFSCHFNHPRGYPPDLRRLDPARHELFAKIVSGGLLRANGMPQWDDVLTAQDVEAIHAYLISISWDAYRAQQKPGPAPESTNPLAAH